MVIILLYSKSDSWLNEVISFYISFQIKSLLSCKTFILFFFKLYNIRIIIMINKTTSSIFCFEHKLNNYFNISLHLLWTYYLESNSWIKVINMYIESTLGGYYKFFLNN